MNEPIWMAIARKELGVKEAAGTVDNPRIVEYHQATSLKAKDDEVAWCSAFANWVMKQAGIKGTDSAAARSWLGWGTALKAPRSGCVAVFSRPPESWSGHVAFYVDETPTHVRVLGGNQGDAVTIASYPKARLLGFRWPEGVA